MSGECHHSRIRYYAFSLVAAAMIQVPRLKHALNLLQRRRDFSSCRGGRTEKVAGTTTA
jgi:hypothetical protein